MEAQAKPSEDLKKENKALKIQVESQKKRLVECQKEIAQSQAHLVQLEQLAGRLQQDRAQQNKVRRGMIE